MKLQFVLTLDNVVVNDRKIDQVTIDWEDDATDQDIMAISQQWVTSHDFLTKRMVGLTHVGESSLTFQKIEA